MLEEHCDLPHACNLFTMLGAYILREHYRLKAEPVSGAAFFCLSPDLEPLAFAERRGGSIQAGLDGFHSWIECKGYAIDFLSPLFPDNVAEIDPSITIPRRAFIRSLASMSLSLPARGDAAGTFLLIPDEVCQTNMFKTFLERPMLTDLSRICTTWYQRPPKKIQSEFQIRDDRGKVTTLRRKDIGIRGLW
ncbi:Protein of unknown function [Bryocella elongata]|uniref:Uncharacterized protein n=1 Tax=Bryocella elongata TaxID=863522 RepID=A0A1H6CDP4_9BACT|nr:Protein of unknown function [Bryocella elongata]